MENLKIEGVGISEKRKMSVLKVWMVLSYLFLAISISSITVNAAWSTKAAKLNGSWKKSGSYQVRLKNKHIYIKKSGKTKMLSPIVKDAYMDNNCIVYSSQLDDNKASVMIYDMKKGIGNCVVAPDSDFHGIMGFYKGYVYYAKGNFAYGGETYKVYIKGANKKGAFAKLGATTRIPSLRDAGGGLQYKNYLIVMGLRGDPSPTYLKIYNMQTGKTKLISSECTTARIINGKLYYSVIKGHQRGEWGYKNYKHTVYKANISGGNRKKIASFIGHYMPPILESSCAYYYQSGSKGGTTGKIIKYNYSSKKKKVSKLSNSQFMEKFYYGSGSVVSAG